MESEYGRIAVIKKDGSEGAEFVISNDVLFGRSFEKMITLTPNK